MGKAGNSVGAQGRRFAPEGVIPPGPTTSPPPLLLLLLLFTSACGGRSPNPDEASAPTGPRAASNLSAASVPIPSSPQRIITLAPNLTEIVFALGAGDRVVGVSQYCNHPPEARLKPRVGALIQINYESLRALEPDLVILLPGQHEVAARLAGLGVATLTVKSESIATIYSGVRTLGAALGLGAKADSLVADRERGVAAMKERLASRGDARPKPKVLLVVGRNPGTLQQIYACGSDNYLNELMEMIGAENALGQTPVPWPVVGKERLLQIDPDVILDASVLDQLGDDRKGAPAPPEDVKFHMAAWGQLPELRAAREGRIIPLTDPRLMSPGPDFLDYADALELAVYGPAPASRPASHRE